MPGMDGPALLAEIKVRYPQLPVIVMTAYSTVKNAVQSMRNGAYDYIAKPFDIDELDITVAKALQFRDIMRDNARMRAELDEHAQFDSLVGDSPAFRRVLHAVDSPVGDPRERKVDVRVIAATNKNLLDAVANKEFREDLYYRLNVFPIPLPALRERVEDIAPLARHFAQTLSATAGKRITGFSPEALQAMAAYSWPGNIRELQNCVERATIVAATPVIEDIDLPAYLFASTPAEDGVGAILSNGPGVPQDLDAALAEVEKAYIMAALQESNGVQAAAAQKIGISERSFWYRLKKLGIQVDKIVR
eukprot:gene645-752_t